MLVSPLSAALFYNKSSQNFFELFYEAQQVSIEHMLASLITRKTFEKKEDFIKLIEESISDKNNINEKILNSLMTSHPHIASIYEKGVFPSSLLTTDRPVSNEWLEIISMALISGICPVFLLCNREITTEIIEKLIKKDVRIEDLSLNQKIKMFIEESLT